MTWTWQYENSAGEAVGTSEEFDQRSDAESWIGTSFEDLLEEGVEQVRLLEDGTDLQQVGVWITTYLGIAHGWLYMIFLITAFLLARRERWELPFTIVTLICGTIPVLSFWAEHRATVRVRAEATTEVADL